MIETLKTKNEFIYAYCEWFRVGDDGKPSDTGKRVHIYDYWVHPKWRGSSDITPKLMAMIKPKCVDCKTCTWQRVSQGDDRVREFSREHFFKRGNK